MKKIEEEDKKPEEIDNQISLLEKFQNQMDLIQEKTGIKGIFVILGLFIAVIFVYFNIFDSIITNLVGTVYPAFWTIKSLEQNSIEEQKKWLTYWVVFGAFIIVDMGSPVIVKFIPFYFVLKILFLMWLFMPGSNGCTIVYYLNDMFHDNNLKNFKNNKISGKKYISLDNKKNMKEDKDNNINNNEIDNDNDNEEKEHND